LERAEEEPLSPLVAREYQRECWTVGVLAHLFLDIAVLGDGSASQNLKIKILNRQPTNENYPTETVPLKVPKCEIFDRSDFDDFYTI